MATFMLDTEIAAGAMRRDPKVLARLDQVLAGDFCISSITHSELMSGAVISRWMKQDMAALDLFVKHVTVLDYPAKAAMQYAVIREALELRGETIDGNKLLVAAHAVCLGLTLIAGRHREYGRMPGLAIERVGA